MLDEVQICLSEGMSEKAKGDFFEDLFRDIMERMRYRVKERIRFAGTEIDLLCDSMDKHGDTILVECKARRTIASQDLKNFSHDLIVEDRASRGFFVHTSELTGQAAGLAENLQDKYKDRVTLVGPSKLMEMLVHAELAASAPQYSPPDGLVATKRILFYSPVGRAWVIVLSAGTVPTHYQVTGAALQQRIPSTEVLRLISEIDDLQGLELLSSELPAPLESVADKIETVAEVQECEKWHEYLPVGGKWFVGRKGLRHDLFAFVQSPIDGGSDRRLFFIEGNSGWGKSSLLAELRARSRNRRNRNRFHVTAVDCRSADSSEFISLAMAKAVAQATQCGFVPDSFGSPTITSCFDVFASREMQSLLRHLAACERVLVVVFDQFEDVFRKWDLFRAFHKLMMDVSELGANVVVGFSWKSEISIPIDNPAYALWQQARETAEAFRVAEFYAYDVDAVTDQLEKESGTRIPMDLRRRLKESSQGFPWLAKKLSIHCYEELVSGATPEELVDQDLNVGALFDDDLQKLPPEHTRALRLIAERSHAGDLFDVTELDERIDSDTMDALLTGRLVVRTGAKYNVYWDVFRDYLVEGEPPRLGESFMLRQYPRRVLETLSFFLLPRTLSLREVRQLESTRQTTEKTALNRLMELRHTGVMVKSGDKYQLRDNIQTREDFIAHMRRRLDEHIVVRDLVRRTSDDTIDAQQVVEALKRCYKGYDFKDTTWQTYANYFIAWLREVGVNLGARLGDTTARTASPATYTPQWRPEKVIELFEGFRAVRDPQSADQGMYKGLYDLKNLGLLTYVSRRVYLTRRGLAVRGMSPSEARREVAALARRLPKIAAAYEADLEYPDADGARYQELISQVLDTMPSESYRKVTANVLRSWARFVHTELDDTTDGLPRSQRGQLPLVYP